MAMDPKQERALRDGTASVADQPRETDIESVRDQAENPPVTGRARARRRTAAVADVRVNQEAGTPVDQMAREIGAEPIPEVGRAPRNKPTDNNGGDDAMSVAERDSSPERGGPKTAQGGEDDAPAIQPREARRAMKARREHSKGDGNFPSPEPSPQLMDDERPQDRIPRDVPKARDDRSAPKGNITAGQDDRNPNPETADDQRPGPPSRAFSLDAARDAAAMPNAAPRPRPIAEAKRAGSTKGQVKDAPGRAAKAEKPKAERTSSMPKPKSRAATKPAGSRPRAQERSRAGSARGAANRAKAKRATTKRAAPKRSAAKRTAPRKRTAAKRAASRAKRRR